MKFFRARNRLERRKPFTKMYLECQNNPFQHGLEVLWVKMTCHYNISACTWLNKSIMHRFPSNPRQTLPTASISHRLKGKFKCCPSLESRFQLKQEILSPWERQHSAAPAPEACGPFRIWLTLSVLHGFAVGRFCDTLDTADAQREDK